jgi:hypothetical protein
VDETTQGTEQKSKGRRKAKNEGEPRQLSTVQLRTLALLGDVQASTERGIYRAGVSDATGRTLASLMQAGYVAPYTVASPHGDGQGEDGVTLYYLTDAGQALLNELRGAIGVVG